MKNMILKNILENLRSKKYNHKEDLILNQERFEPVNWSIPLDKQIILLQENYLIGSRVDSNYFTAISKKTPEKNMVRVAVPKLSYLAKLSGLEDPYMEIGVLIERVCELLLNQRQGKFTHYRKGQLGPNRIQCIKKLANRRRELEDKVPGDILILDVDLGNKYAGWTPRRAREYIICNSKKLALSSVDLCWILLLNPDRLQKNTDLSFDSVMEEYLSEDRGWVTNLFFYFRGGKLEFGYRWNRRAYFDCGATFAVSPISI